MGLQKRPVYIKESNAWDTTGMNKEATTIKEKCQECQFSIYKEESYAGICYRGLEDSLHGILGLRDPTN